MFTGGKTNSVRRNGLIKIAQQGATAFLCGRHQAQLKQLVDATDQAGQAWNELYVHMLGIYVGQYLQTRYKTKNNELFIKFVENHN